MEASSTMGTFEAHFGKKIRFPQFYDLFKRKKQYIFIRNIFPNGIVSVEFLRMSFFW